MFNAAQHHILNLSHVHVGYIIKKYDFYYSGTAAATAAVQWKSDKVAVLLHGGQHAVVKSKRKKLFLFSLSGDPWKNLEGVMNQKNFLFSQNTFIK